MRIPAPIRTFGATALRDAMTRASEMGHAWRHRASLQDQDGWSRLGSKALLVRGDTDLDLPARRERALEAMRELLDANAIDHISIPTRANRPGAVGVLEVHREEVLSALAASTAFRHWRVCDAVDRLGTPVVGSLDSPRWRAAGGLRLWDVVQATPASRFRAGPTEGVEVIFFREDPETEQLLSSMVAIDGIAAITAEQFAERDAAGVPLVWAEGHALGEVRFDIDLVYTWVDGADPEWRESKRMAKLALGEVELTERSDDESRFADHDELRFSLRSVAQFAPWIRHIWIVTAGQRPEWLSDAEGVSVVDHREIWPDSEGLPNFNSHAIEANLHRIEGLSEHFLYMNDDMLFGRPVAPEQFFHGNGVAKAFFSKATVDFGPAMAGEIASTTAAKTARALVLRSFGAFPVRKYFHTAMALTKTRQRQLDELYPDVMTATRHAQFRTTEDVAAAGSLTMAVGLANGGVVPGRIKYDYIDPVTSEGAARMRRYLNARHLDAFCINDGSTAEDNASREATHRRIGKWLQEFLPVPSRFER